MTMVKAHVFTQELVAGRYRLVDVVHRETNRVCWYGNDVEDRRPYLLTEVALPQDPEGGHGARVAARARRMSDTMGMVAPGRVATVVDAVPVDGSLWTVTDRIDAAVLSELLARHGPLEPPRAARIGLELLAVLAAAHREGITHGELSPGQVYVREDDSVVVTGFGLAGATLAPRLTAPSYASPEQARDERIGPAADLWALGAILYTMLEGRAPYRERDRPEATLRGVDRLPLRAPVRAGPLGRTVQGLLRKDCRERLTRAVVRDALLKAAAEDPGSAPGAGERPADRDRYRGPGRGRRALVGGTALATVTVAVAVLAATHGLPGTDESPAGAATHPSAAPSASGTRTEGSGGRGPEAGTSASAPTASPSPTPSASLPAPSATRPGASRSGPPPGTPLPAGFRVLTSPEGFSVALPAGWRALETARSGDLASRVTFGAPGDPRTLAVTYSERVGADPVAVWRDDVEPDLARSAGFRRLGDIEATTYQGRSAADMEWLSEVDGARVRTLGRGFLLGGGRGFSLRWSTPAADWDDATNRRALETFFRTFRVTSG
ncbi:MULTISPECIES: serine/threonine protein kinase [Streptomyces]|uniref:non-specific serine/threonine protein kinase n=1 Tax=Streptomyces doudnae TaxID=3075536 RepID=A0ABD5F1Y1_9ACTN|nr:MULTISPECIES: protein kinase [unclassified Streptomyces]MDT0440412.1 protein kinase [Streptomyces sp. DSM 41981]MYQ66509.1 protein kinase [Streptomyces sp. SID4950]